MKSRFVQCSAVASLLAAAAFAPAPAVAQQKCVNPTGMIDKRACAKAAEGADALRYFVSRTRMIWQLNIWDYAEPVESSASAVATKQALRETELPRTQVVVNESR